MSFPTLSLLAQHAPLRCVLVHAGAAASPLAAVSLSLAGLAAPLQEAARLLGPERLLLDIVPLPQATHDADALLGAHIVLLVADEPPPVATCQALATHWRGAALQGAVGGAVLSLARAGLIDGLRAALPWQRYAEAEAESERVVFVPYLYALDGRLLSCCGGAASLDCATTLVESIWGATLADEVRVALGIDQVRGPQERQRSALQARFGALQPKLAEAVALMEANIEEPLATDDIAGLVGISRRQLERQFKQYLGSVPSRYYLELRLQRARRLLRDTNDSIVQIGLMCGFSSGSHFSTAYGAQFGITPREERQRKLRAS